MKVNRIAVMFAILAAALYAINIPLCKIILSHIAPTMLAALVLGFVSYGLSINFYIKAQKDLGAAKTGAYYSIAPFLGVIIGIVFLGERPTVGFFIGLVLMAAATWLMIRDTVTLQHTHEHEHAHNHEHSHDGVCHAHLHSHLHSHIHTHGSDDSDHSHNHALTLCHNHAH